jgi:sugar O-acyltransferase (sialic acid O-acetyltransferase NeuD family)
MKLAKFSRSSQSKRELFIFGAGGHAASIASLGRSCGYKVVGFIESSGMIQDFKGLPVFTEEIFQRIQSINLVLAIGDNFQRFVIEERISKLINDSGNSVIYPRLIHPYSEVSHDASVGIGSCIFPGVTVGSESEVGKHCILNHQSSLDHESQMMDFSSLSPGAITGGRVNIGIRTSVMMNASVAHNIKIGNDVVIGANSFLSQDAQTLNFYAGSPARVVRERYAGEKYL